MQKTSVCGVLDAYILPLIKTRGGEQVAWDQQVTGGYYTRGCYKRAIRGPPLSQNKGHKPGLTLPSAYGSPRAGQLTPS